MMAAIHSTACSFKKYYARYLVTTEKTENQDMSTLLIFEAVLRVGLLEASPGAILVGKRGKGERTELGIIFSRTEIGMLLVTLARDSLREVKLGHMFPRRILVP